MQTIGDFLHKNRSEKNISISDLEKITKIKASFIEKIEKGEWSKLPEKTVVSGFVKSISDALGLDSGKTMSLFRRDFPPQNTSLNPKPDIKKEFKLSPKVIFALIVTMFSIILGAYLTYQYVRFISPPKLLLESPVENQEINKYQILIKGKTDVDAVITANNQPILTDDNGNFEYSLSVSENTEEIEIKATSRYGKISVIKRKINVVK